MSSSCPLGVAVTSQSCGSLFSTVDSTFFTVGLSLDSTAVAYIWACVSLCTCVV